AARQRDLPPAAAQRRVDEPCRLRGNVERAAQRPSEEWRHGEHSSLHAVYAAELRLPAEEAEDALPALEHRSHGIWVAARDGDIASHRAEASVHDVDEATGGGWTAGAIWPPCTTLR